MLLLQLNEPSWAPLALTLASVAVVTAALVVSIMAYRNNRNR